ncbi:SELENOT [Lepeophtheirus salmonis]|uniref:SELENOT n=1 Tax=Lepeophtheirus salmonis TaxID=72036 RepID=A0A7R8D610_LEPSM|nr:SELENOT [Lepeophtheirus salmonis]CAF3040781.1 SELENOT [Lepeophtheirus salmonis]
MTELSITSKLALIAFLGCSRTEAVQNGWTHTQSFVLLLLRLYRKVFEQYADILRQKYPGLLIEGDNFPPPSWKYTTAQALGLYKNVIVVCLAFGLNPFELFGANTPAFYAWMSQNRFYSALMVFFLTNAVETQLISTGAFEVTLNDLPVWSKIESGRIPQPPELFQIIDNYMKMSTPEDAIPSLHL